MNKEEVIYPSMVIRSQAEAIESLEKENQKYKEVINKAIEYILKETKSMPVNGCTIRLKELLDILKEVKTC